MLIRRRTALLADDMGLGKTIQAISAMKALLSSGAIRRALVVCPASLTRNWRSEVVAWGDGLPAVLYEGADRHGMLEGGAPLLVGSYETVVGDLASRTSKGALYADIGIDLLILDEAQRIKDSTALKSRVLAKVVAARRWAITGTPLENHPAELASIIRFLVPNEDLEGSLRDDYAALLQLRDRFMIRRTKQEVAHQLPPRIVSYVPVDLNPDQASEYGRLLSEVRGQAIRESGRRGAKNTLIAGLQQLRRAAAVSSTGSSAKIDLVEQELEEVVANGEKAIVFSSFAKLVLPLAAKRFERFGSLLYTGDLSPEARSEAHRRFVQDQDCRVMCASIIAAGVGLTWTVAQHIYHLDLWWNPQVLRQAEDRAHRIGQESTVIIKRLIAEGTVDVGIRNLLDAKEEIFDFVIGDQQALVKAEPEMHGLLALIGLKSTDVRATMN